MRTIPDPGFADDDGSAPERLSAALSVYEQDPDGGYLATLAALCGARLLVPVVAVPGELSTASAPEGDHGLAQGKSSDMSASSREGSGGSEHVEMAAVLMQRPDGRKALLAFTSSTSLTDWNAEGRPVPVPARTAARAAIQDGADALLVDLAGPVRFVVEGEDLAALGRGWTLVRLEEGWGWQTDVQ